MNRYLVGANSIGVAVMNPPRGPMSADEALNLIAWVATLAGIEAHEIQEAIAAVESDAEIPSLEKMRERASASEAVAEPKR